MKEPVEIKGGELRKGNDESIIKFDSMEGVIQDIKEGKLVIVLDDAGRENEGDFIGAGGKVTKDTIDFMVKQARGAFIAAFCESGRCEELGIPPQRTEIENTESNRTRMMVSVDCIGGSSGSSAFDRAMTLNVLAHPDTRPSQLRKPGHVIPIEAVPGGILERRGHTEAGVELVKLAGFKPAVAVDLEILNDEGNMARHEDLVKIAKKHNLKITSIEHIKQYMQNKK